MAITTSYLQTLIGFISEKVEMADGVAHELVRDRVLPPRVLEDWLAIRQSLMWIKHRCEQAEFAARDGVKSDG